MKDPLSLLHLLIGIYFLTTLSCVNSQDTTNQYSSFKKNAVCCPSSTIRYPTCEQEVVDIVNEAILTGKTVKAFGARHSATDIICTEGIPVDMQGVQSFQMNSDGTATFGAGVNLRSATEYLRHNYRALRTTPAFGNISISGAVGTGAHGSSIKYHASISSQVVGVRIVDGKGKVRDISDREELKAFKIHLGLLGIILKVTVSTVPLYKTMAYNYKRTDDILLNGVAIEIAKNTDTVTLYWFPAFNEVVVANWTIVDAKTPGNDFTYDHVPSTYASFNFIGTVAKEAAFSLTSSTCALANTVGYTILHVIEYFMELALLIQVPLFVPIYTENGYTIKMPAVGYYDLMFAPICYNTPRGLLGAACPWEHGPNSILFLDNEFGLDLADLPYFISDIKDIMRKTPTAFPLIGVLMRFSDKSDIYMSTAYGRQTVHFEWYMWHRKDLYEEPSGSLAGYQTILQLLTQKYKARSHWGKSGLVYHNRESIKLKLDPVARKKFVAVMNKYDPDEVFINNFGRRIKETGWKVDVDPKITRCALVDNCFCSRDCDCGKNQLCTTISGYNYKVCKTKNEIPPATFDKCILPEAPGILNFLINQVGTMTTALLGNCSVDALLEALGDTTGNTLCAFIAGLGSFVEATLNGVVGVVLNGTISGTVNGLFAGVGGILG